MKAKFLLTIASLVLFVTFSYAQSEPGSGTPNVTKRQFRQERRIREGRRSGELTPAESARLQGQQAKIRHDKRAAKADGVVTKQERAKLHHEQRRANRTIARKKHNGRTR